MARYAVEPFEYWHMKALECLAPGDAAGFVFSELTAAQCRYLQTQNSWTLLADTEPVACGGTMEMWPGRHQVWVYTTPTAGRCMVRISRLAKLIIEPIVGRIESTVRADFKQGHRWAKMMGFEVEAPLMRGYSPRGEDHVGYVRIQ